MTLFHISQPLVVCIVCHTKNVRYLLKYLLTVALLLLAQLPVCDVSVYVLASYLRHYSDIYCYH